MTFGAAYVLVLPGDSAPVIRGYSPRKMTVVYGDDDVWPVAGLEWLGGKRYRLIDSEAVYYLTSNDHDELELSEKDTQVHEAGVCPIVRFRDTLDLDVDV